MLILETYKISEVGRAVKWFHCLLLSGGDPFSREMVKKKSEMDK